MHIFQSRPAVFSKASDSVARVALMLVGALSVSPTAALASSLATAPGQEAGVVSAIAQLDPSAAVSVVPSDEAIDTFIQQMMADRHIPGLTLAVIQDQKLIKAQGYGVLDHERNVHARPSSIFPIASMSKPLTATAMMLLVQDGKIDLDAPIGTYLTEAPEHWEQVTVRRLLNHTAGLSERAYEDDHLISPADFVAKAAVAPLDFEPGAAWMYSNTGYSLASSVVEAVSDQPFADFMAERIFEPLGMSQTDVVRDSYMFSNRAMGYFVGEGGTWQPVSDFFRYSLLPRLMPGLQGAGSITSNVVDLARWEIALQKGQLLAPDMQLAMQQPGTMNSGRITDYGLGWIVQDINGHTAVSHGGNLWGYSTSISRFVDDDITIIVLTNKDSESGDWLAQKIAEQYVPELVVDLGGSAIADPNPALTKQILAFMTGDETAIEFTPERQVALTSTVRGQSIRAAWADRVRTNPLQSLELLSQTDHPNGQQYRYRATSNSGEHLLTAVVTPEGLIASLGISLDE
ncbi:MAG: serine hydrolase domain-containing protein [Cyanobacteria bacterium J06614_10]